MKVAEAIRAKDLSVTVTPRVTTRLQVREHVVISCACGQSVSGDGSIVDEAHRQHLRNHKR